VVGTIHIYKRRNNKKSACSAYPNAENVSRKLNCTPNMQWTIHANNTPKEWKTPPRWSGVLK
jgi:hypothetical protein